MLRARLDALGRVLSRWRSVWEHRPYVAPEPPWRDALPELVRHLESLPKEAIEAVEDGRDALPARLLPWQEALGALCALPKVPARHLPPPTDPELRRGMSPRKWQQVLDLGAAARAAADEAGFWLDWCAGKGHLGRTLSLQDGRRAHLLELESDLCAAGAARAAALGAHCTFHAGDALAPAAAHQVRPERHAVALHACGGLSDALLRASANAGAGLTIAPCCPHRHRPDGLWHPWASSALPPLPARVLRLATAQESVASPHRRELRTREMVFRWGLDLLRREADGVDHYRPVGACPRGWSRAGFETFVSEASRQHHLALPTRWSPQQVLAAAEAHVTRARALALARAQFRRPLEIFVWLDRATWLHEQGQDVHLGLFTDPRNTPRNLAIVAHPSAGPSV